MNYSTPFNATDKERTAYRPENFERPNVTKAMHDEVVHWQAQTNTFFIGNTFWWPVVQLDVRDYLRSCKPSSRVGALVNDRNEWNSASTWFVLHSFDQLLRSFTSKTLLESLNTSRCWSLHVMADYYCCQVQKIWCGDQIVSLQDSDIGAFENGWSNCNDVYCLLRSGYLESQLHM